MKTTVVINKNGQDIIAKTIIGILKEYNIKKRNDLHYIRLNVSDSIAIIIKMLRCIDSDSSFLVYAYSVDLYGGKCSSLISSVIPYRNAQMRETAIESFGNAIANISLSYVSSVDCNTCDIISYTGEKDGSILDIYIKHEIEYDRKTSFVTTLNKHVMKYIKQLNARRNTAIFKFAFSINDDDPVYKATGEYRAVITHSGYSFKGESAYSVKTMMPQTDSDCYDFVTYDDVRDILVDTYGGVFGAVNDMLMRNEQAHLIIYTLRPECTVPKQ